jgi:hypothetical protein
MVLLINSKIEKMKSLNKNFLSKLTPQVVGLLFISNDHFDQRSPYYEEINYISNGLILKKNATDIQYQNQAENLIFCRSFGASLSIFILSNTTCAKTIESKIKNYYKILKSNIQKSESPKKILVYLSPQLNTDNDLIKRIESSLSETEYSYL